MNESRSPALECEGVEKSFGGVAVLAGASLRVEAGDTLAISGASGSGKTTLLHILGGLDVPDAGRAGAGGRDWAGMDLAAAAAWRNRMLGFVFQFHLLLPEFSALENAAMPLIIRRRPREEALEAARESLARLGMAAHESKTPDKLSGGERQRVAVARAMTGRPACILADEPTGSLDRKNAEAVFDMMLEAAAAQRAALVVVSHDEKLAARARRRAVLLDGALKEETPA